MKFIRFFIVAVIIFFPCCVISTVEEEANTLDSESPMNKIQEEDELPDWIYSPPKEEGYFFGIGCDIDFGKAKQKSIVNIGQQFGTRVKSVLLDETSNIDQDKFQSIVSIDEQLSDQTVKGAKFINNYEDQKGMHWVLTRAPLTCLMDAAECVLLSYQMELLLEENEFNQIIKRLDDGKLFSDKYIAKQVIDKVDIEPVFFEGQIIVNTSSTINIWNDSNLTEIEIPNPHGKGMQHPVLSPVGDKFVFAISPGGGKDPFKNNWDLWSMNIDGSQLKQLTFTEYAEACPIITPDGTKVVYQAHSDSNGNCDLWVMNIDGSEKKQLTNTRFWDSDPSISPDGKEILFMSYESDDVGSIWHINIDGSNKYQVLEDITDNKDWGAVDTTPAWSPDGKKILFSSRRGYNGINTGWRNRNLWTYDLEDGTLVQLTNNNHDEQFAEWSPSGEFIAYSRKVKDENPTLWIMNSDGDNQRMISNRSTYIIDWKNVSSF